MENKGEVEQDHYSEEDEARIIEIDEDTPRAGNQEDPMQLESKAPSEIENKTKPPPDINLKSVTKEEPKTEITNRGGANQEFIRMESD